MGASNSTLEEDKTLQLCRARKKFIKQALNGRCSLAEAHIAYIEELKIVGAALRRFVEFDAQAEPFERPSRSPTPEPHSLKSVSSRSLSQNVNAIANLSPPSKTPVSIQFQSHHMKFRGTSSTKVEEKPPVPVAVSVSATEASSLETAVAPENSPWDYFGLFHPIDEHFSSHEGRGFDNFSEKYDEIMHQMVEVVHEVEDTEEKLSSVGIEDSQISEDEFDEASSANLVRSFNNVNRSEVNVVNEDSPSISSENRASETKEAKENLVDGVSPPRSSEISETKLMNGKENTSPDLSPLRATSSRFVHVDDVTVTPTRQSDVEDRVVSKDFFLSMKDIEQLFAKASESGKEVPRMLEANKFHFRPVIPGNERGSVASSLLKSCFSCGEDPSEVPQVAPQDSVKYLTWHRTTSSPSASSRNLLGANSTDGVEDVSNNLFDNSCMVSGSHASTLDRLYAWEKKLYDEVKAGQMLRSNFDQKCKLLRQQESRGENADKTRAAVKGLHSRIRVAIQRIDSISKKIEEIRDKELQPQLEELIDGLAKMWELMLECHKVQFHVISVSHSPGNTKISMHSDSRRQTTIHLQNQLASFSSTFTKWIAAQKLYVESIDKWLFKCVVLPQNPSKRNKRMRPPPIRNAGPPIYLICGSWMEMIDKLPATGVVDSVKDLEAEVAHFLPHQDKNRGKSFNPGTAVSKDQVSEDWVPALDQFRTRLAGFLGQLNSFAESSVVTFMDLQKLIREAKSNYQQIKSQKS